MLLRVFGARPGRERELLDCLRDLAARMIQQRTLDAVQICQYADRVDRVVWIEDRRTAPGSERFLEAEGAATWATTLVDGLVSQAFEIVDGYYHYPLPRCRVWSLEVAPAAGREQDTLTGFLDLSRAVSLEPSVAGLSIYRMLGEPCRFLVFVALKDGVVPSGPFVTAAPPDSWRPLLVVWTMGRLSSGRDPRAPAASGRHPRATFWARTMPVVAVGPAEEGE
jgi:hypothetical protein